MEQFDAIAHLEAARVAGVDIVLIVEPDGQEAFYSTYRRCAAAGKAPRFPTADESLAALAEALRATGRIIDMRVKRGEQQ